MSQHAFVYVVLRARAFLVCVRVQFYVWRSPIIQPTEGGLSLKCLVKQQLFKSLLIFYDIVCPSNFQSVSVNPLVLKAPTVIAFNLIFTVD